MPRTSSSPTPSSASPRRTPRRRPRRSDVEAEIDHVAVLHDVVLSFRSEARALAGRREAAGGDQIVERGHLGPDEAALEVGVDGARGAGGARAGADRPGAAFVLARREELDQPEETE